MPPDEAEASDRGVTRRFRRDALDLYLDGRGVRRDPARGHALLEKACDAKEQRACKQLGKLGEKTQPAPATTAPGATPR